MHWSDPCFSMIMADTFHSDEAVRKQIVDHKPNAGFGRGRSRECTMREKVHNEQTEEKQACPLMPSTTSFWVSICHSASISLFLHSFHFSVLERFLIISCKSLIPQNEREDGFQTFPGHQAEASCLPFAGVVGHIHARRKKQPGKWISWCPGLGTSCILQTSSTVS